MAISAANVRALDSANSLVRATSLFYKSERFGARMSRTQRASPLPPGLGVRPTAVTATAVHGTSFGTWWSHIRGDQHIGTSFAEGRNLNMRMRAPLHPDECHSKKVENYMWFVALFTTCYYYVRIRRTLPVSPAMPPA